MGGIDRGSGRGGGGLPNGNDEPFDGGVVIFLGAGRYVGEREGGGGSEIISSNQPRVSTKERGDTLTPLVMPKNQEREGEEGREKG